MNTFLQIENEVAQMMNTRQMPGVLSTSIGLFLSTCQWLKHETGDKDHLEVIESLCEHAEKSDSEDWDKLQTFADQLLIMQFYGGKGQLFATKHKQEEYRRMFLRAYYNCYLYLLEWFDEESEEISECIPYSEYLWDDFQMCSASNTQSRILFWKVSLKSYQFLKERGLLPVKPIIANVLTQYSKESYIFRNHYFAYLYQLVFGLTILSGSYLIASIGKLLYSLLVLLPYNRLLLYSGAKVYSDNINEYLTLKGQLNSVLFANRESLIGFGIGIILLFCMDMVYQYKRTKIY